MSEYCDRLERVAAMDTADYVGDAKEVSSARYELIAMVEAAIGICNHIVSRHGVAPATYADCFSELNSLGAITEATASSMARAARLRNLVVHQYADVDDALFHSILREDLGDVRAFAREVAGWLAG